MGDVKRIVAHDDRELVVRLISGDEKAFNILYNKYHVPIYRNILKLVRNEEVAKDILQEVFVSLWEKKNKIEINQQVANWLFVVSYNKSLSYIRKNANALVVFEELIVDVSEDNTEPFITEEKLAFIEASISKLSPQRKRALELCKIERKTYDEAAREMGISRHTVKEYIADAMALLRLQVKENIGESAILLIVMLFLPFFKK